MNFGRNLSPALLLFLALDFSGSTLATAAVLCDQLRPESRAAAKEAGKCVSQPDLTAIQRQQAAQKYCPQLPDFVQRQMSYDAVVKELPSNVVPEISGRRPSSAPAGTVLEQSIKWGVKACWAGFVISDGSLVRVPSLRNYLKEEAIQRLFAGSLKAEIRDVEAPFVRAAGRVTEQEPAAGKEVPRDSVVRIFVAHPSMVELPNVIGLGVQEAKSQLGRFAVSTSLEPGLRPRDEVIDQTPAGGMPVALGSAVVLKLSDYSLVQVPALVGYARAKSLILLERSQLSAQTDEKDSEAPMGNVLSQDPEAGSTVQRQSTVRLGISAGLPVPGLVGQNVSDASSSLKAFVIQTEKAESERPLGEIVSQSPRGGDHASAHSTITLKVADGSIVLPDLNGMMLSDARLVLQRTGELSVNIMEGYSWGGAIVSETTPAAGRRVQRGSEIAIKLKPIRPWVWIAIGGGLVAALTAAAVACSKLWLRPSVTVRTGIAFNVAPLDAEARGPELPVIGLRVGLRRGPVTVREHEETLL